MSHHKTHHLLLVILGNFLDADAKGRLSELVDHQLAVGRQLEDLLVLHPVHVVVHED